MEDYDKLRFERMRAEYKRENAILRANHDNACSEASALARENESMRLAIERLSTELAKPEDARLREVIEVMEGRAATFDSLASRVGAVLDELDEWISRAGSAERTVADQQRLLASSQNIERDLRRSLAEASQLAEERLGHAHQLQADIDAEREGRLTLRQRFGARDDETMGAFIERLAVERNESRALLDHYSDELDIPRGMAPSPGELRRLRQAAKAQWEREAAERDGGVPAEVHKRVPAEVHERGWQWRPVGPDTAFAPPFGAIRVCRGCGCLVAGGPTACVRCAGKP